MKLTKLSPKITTLLVDKIDLNISARFKYFPGATFKDLLHYVDTTLQDNSFQVALIHIGINDIVQIISTHYMLQSIKNIVQKCMAWCGMQNVLISGLLITNRLA